ncbi:MAG: hypothetical protein EXS18_03995 [Verrucomicrobiae bacterium]|nr:hypothetical protein [Verrucomicrobiae bacterium]
MRKLDQLNPRARRMVQALLDAFPQFRSRLEVLEHGDFRTHICAPKGSKVFGLRVCTARGGEDAWIQFGVPNAFYDADSAKQLLKIVRGLISDRLKFALKEKNGKWVYTTLVRKSGDVVLGRGETGKMFSWSGTKDKTLVPKTVQRTRLSPRR